ncbi:MAG: type I 3-dehydroquinate dehydratase [Methanospirillaceae archaeon]|nr:type I 3-dehydroquinate dehydratase [Methanospirillaceae archaeon]
MQPAIALSLTSRAEPSSLARFAADLIEIRLDLIPGVEPDWVHAIKQECSVPLILTLRSREEGGRFMGSLAEWSDGIGQYRGIAEYIDIEERFSAIAPRIRATGRESVIASCHLNTMPDEDALSDLCTRLSRYGDIPKIAVAPENEHDLIRFAAFTVSAQKPVITSIMGERFRWARAFLGLLGSSWIYCHGGEAAAGGQYHIDEMKTLLLLLR